MKPWKEKLHARRQPEVKRIDKAFGGMPADSLVLISSPLEVDCYVKQIPKGELRTPKQMREDLAQRHGAQHTCPVTAGIFLRIVAEVAYEELQNGKTSDDITPFWRVIAPDAPLAKKLACGAGFVAQMRRSEEA